MRTHLVPLTLLSLSLTMPAAAKTTASPGDILPYEATERTLANGLKVIVVPTGFPNLVSLQIVVQTGSRNEVEPGKTGFAHFFEHLMFRGTKNISADEYQAIITKAGARQNAYTEDDFTNYHITFAKEDLPRILEIEADRFMNLEYPLELFQTEAKAVLGEYNKNFSNPFRQIDEAIRDAAYQRHTYKHTTMGFLADIQAMPEQFDYSWDFFARWYRPEYTTIVVAGDVKPDDVLTLVEKCFGTWEPGSHVADIPQEPAPNGPVYVHKQFDSPTLPILTVAFHGPEFSETETDCAAMELLLALRFGETSELYRRLVQDEQKVDSLFYWSATNEDPSLIYMFARVKDPADVVTVRDAILATAAAARETPVTAEELEEAKAHQRYAQAAALDSSEAIASTLARFVRYRRSFDTMNNWYKLIDRLTPADLQKAARAYFTDERLAVATLSQNDLGLEVSSLPRLASFAGGSSDDLAPSRLIVQHSKSPQIVMKLMFDAGSAQDPPGKEGLANLTARMVADAGSESRTYAEIQKALYPMAGRFSAKVDKEMTTFTLSVHRDNLDRFLDIALDQLFRPGMRDDDFQRNKDALTNELLQDLRTNDDEELGKERLQANVFAGTPYGHPALGTVAGIASLTPDDVRAFIKRNYGFPNLTVGISGDAPASFAADFVTGLRTSLPRDAKAQGLAPTGKIEPGLTVEIIEKPTRGTAVSFGHPIEVTRSHPDFVALWLARTWLGEHRSSMSHLYQRIREVRGMNYGDYAYIEAFPNGGRSMMPRPNVGRRAQLFEVWIRPVDDPEFAHHALRIALHEVDDLVTNGLTQDEFESTRDYLMKNVYVMTDGQDEGLGYALDSAWYGTSDFVSLMRDRLASLSVGEVNDALRRHIHPDNVHIVMVTKDGDALRQRLLADTPSAMKYPTEKPAELLEEDEVIGAMKLELEETDVKVTKVDDVFAG